ncbi:hypothetical protein Drose_24910 [Dactylosporangium roseum]|uniref:Integral membrane protein n=1 Tax=Dactylosporangium roseum TaxID=47989 RepID=A0ABY5YY45_9ACTN|nr:SCO6880 family protein [Dactylosporangium roseum]UWZ34457.1 hypothetical protein Drose_24910 [Dactylosporangium roseum]
MAASMTEPARRQRTYGNWRLGTRAGLFGLGPAGTIAAFVVIVIAAALLVVSFMAAVIAAVVGALVLTPLAIRINGRTGLQALAARISWWLGRSARQHMYFSGIASPVTDKHKLPGILAQSQLFEVETGRAGRIAVVVVPQSRHYTVTLRCAPEGTDLVDQPVIDARVARLAGWLSSLCREPMLVQAQVSVETTPDPGTALTAEVEATTRPDAPALARRVLEEVVRTYPAGSAKVDTLVSLTFTPPAGRKWSHEDTCREVAARLPYLHAGLTGAGGSAIVPLTADALMRVVRGAYDPAVNQDLERDTETSLEWSQVGPVAAREAWDFYRHDSGISRTWGMAEAPRGVVFSNTFSRLSEPDPTLLRKRTTIMYRPFKPAEAARLVETDKRDARFTASKKPQPTARDLVDVAAADQAAEEEAVGAGIVRFTVLVTATVETEADLEEANSIIRSRAGEARLSLRPMYGCQAAAFAAGLPTGVLLNAHASIPY